MKRRKIDRAVEYVKEPFNSAEFRRRNNVKYIRLTNDELDAVEDFAKHKKWKMARALRNIVVHFINNPELYKVRPCKKSEHDMVRFGVSQWRCKRCFYKEPYNYYKQTVLKRKNGEKTDERL